MMTRSAGVRMFLLCAAAAVALAAGATAAAAPPFLSPVVLGVDAGGGPWLTAQTAPGCLHGESQYSSSCWLTGWLAEFDFSLGGTDVAVGDVTGDGRPDIVTVPRTGGRAEVRAFDGAGTLEPPAWYAGPNSGGRNVALGDVNGDGRLDLILGNDASGGPNVQVLDGRAGRQLSFFSTNSNDYNDGIRVAAGDVNGDGRAEIVTANGPGLEPRVSVYVGAPAQWTPTPLRSFLAFDASARGGLAVAAGDLTGDGRADIVVATPFTAQGPELKVFDGVSGGLLTTVFPFTWVAPDSLRVTVGDVNGDGSTDIVVAGDTYTGPQIEALSATGAPLFSLPGVSAKESVGVGDVTGDGRPDLVVSDGPGQDSRVTVFSAEGRLEAGFSAYGPSFTNGVRVAAGDFQGDGGTEYVGGQGPGGSSQVDVFDKDGASLLTLHPFAGAASDGVYVASADVNGDRHADLVVGADAGGEPRVKVFDLAGRQLASFLAFDAGMTGGVRVAAGDLDGDGKAEIVVGSGPGQPALVRVFTATGTLLRTIIPFSPFFTGGVYPAVGDLNGDGRAEIAVGAGAGGDGIVRTFDANGTALASFQPYGTLAVDVRVAIGDVLGDGRTEIVTAAGRESRASADIFRPDGTSVGSWTANNNFRGGQYVAVQEPLGPALEAATPDVRGVEGNRARLHLTISDSARAELATDYTAIVSWGDHTSSAAQIADQPDGIVAILDAHPYRRPGSYVVQVSVADHLHRSLVATGTATILDAPLRAESRVLRLSASRVVQGTIATFKDGNPLAAAADFTASIAWGDGSRSTGRVELTGAGRLRVVATHRYARRAARVVIVRLSDRNGAAATARTRVQP